MDEMEKELAKAAGTLAKDVAEDLVRPTSKSIGENMGLLVDGVMGWLGYWGQKQQIKRAVHLEEYKKQIAKKIAEIPEENLIEPPVRIVGPAIEASKFFIEETTCREMFAQLIASSCNSAVSGAVHPSFPEIIKQLSPLDARFLLLFKKQSTFPIVELTEKDANGIESRSHMAGISPVSRNVVPSSCRLTVVVRVSAKQALKFSAQSACSVPHRSVMRCKKSETDFGIAVVVINSTSLFEGYTYQGNSIILNRFS